MIYKEKAKAYFTAVSDYNLDKVEQMLDSNYIQHNPFVPTGRAAFLEILLKLKEHGSKIENVRIFEDGPFVIMHHKWKNAIPFGHKQTVAFHIIRFDLQGFIGEHWNVMMADTDSSTSLADGETLIQDLQNTDKNKTQISELFKIICRCSKEEVSSRISHFFHERFLKHEDFVGPNYLKLHKVFGEGNFVISISEGLQFGIKSAIYDLFRLQEKKIAEHWRITQEIPTENLLNNNTMFGF